MKKVVLGIDGGGTKTDIAVADLDGNLIRKIKGGPASLRNNGVEESCRNILKSLNGLEEEVVSAFVGFPAFQEEYSDREGEIESLLSGIAQRVKIGSDQLVAFSSGTDEEEGIVAIAGTGSVVRGFAKKDIKAGGWGYFADEGSAFWAGIEAYRAIAKSLDGRGENTRMTEIIFEEWGIETHNDLNKKVYEDPMKNIPFLSVIVDHADRRGDVVAGRIIEASAVEILKGVKVVAEKADFSKFDFPVVAVGGMFRSNKLKEIFSKNIKLTIPRSKVIFPEVDPVAGAVKLAIKYYHAKK